MERSDGAGTGARFPSSPGWAIALNSALGAHAASVRGLRERSFCLPTAPLEAPHASSVRPQAGPPHSESSDFADSFFKVSPRRPKRQQGLLITILSFRKSGLGLQHVLVEHNFLRV